LFDSERSGSAEYQRGLKAVFEGAVEVLGSGDKYEVVKIDKTGHRIVLRTSSALGFTWLGEDIALEFSSLSPRKTLVRVTSSYMRSVDPKKHFGDRNTKNVNEVLYCLSDYFESESLDMESGVPEHDQTDKLSPTKQVSSSDSKSPILNERSAVVFVVFGIVALVSIALSAGAIRGQTSADAPKDISSSQSTPSSSQSKPPQQQASSTSCTESETAVTMVRNIFADSSATPSQVSLILDESARMWAQDAVTASGSKRDWLLKMNELAVSVSSYIITGAPEDGPTKLDQLFANMALTPSFCP
jgi:hypothetical protein